jgi:hypothetical protein
MKNNLLFTVSVGVAIGFTIMMIAMIGIMFVRILTLPLPQATSEHQIVKAVCDYTRTSDDSEQSCVEAMKASGTEYLCRSRNNSVDNFCWVEENPQISSEL